jgi:hypothetical protein
MSHDPELMAQAKAAFMAWAERTGPALIDPGSPLQTVALTASPKSDARHDYQPQQRRTPPSPQLKVFTMIRDICSRYLATSHEEAPWESDPSTW